MPRVPRYRRARVLLAFLLVPLVMFSNPTHAAAAVEGEWKSVTIDFPTEPLDERFNINTCVFNVQHIGTAVNIGNGSCKGLSEVSLGYPQPSEAGAAFTMRFLGEDRLQGGGCTSSTGGVLGPHPNNGFIRVWGSISSSTPDALFGSEDQCDVTQVCMTNDREYYCAPLLLPYPGEVPAGPCPAGSMHVKGEWVMFEDWGGGAGQFRYEVTFTTPPSVSTAQWGYAVRWGDGRVDEGAVSQATIAVRQTAASTPPTWEPVGVQVYAFTGAEGMWNTAPVDFFAANVNANQPQSAGQPYHGWTQPAQCRFYYGTQVANVGGTDEDMPVGGLGTTYEAPTWGPEPEIIDPPPVEEPSNWLAAIWAVLKSILGTLGGLASAIANAITSALGALLDGVLSGLEALFVPESTMKSHVQEVQTAYEGSFPFNFGEALNTMGVGESSSGDGAGCPSWTVHVGSYQWSAVCESSFTAAIRNARPFLAAGLIVAAFWPLVRGMFYASIPLIKPVPSGGDR